MVKTVSFEIKDSDPEVKQTRNKDHIRYHELHGEIFLNSKWLNMKNEHAEEEIYNVEIRENDEYEKLCSEAKEAELQNFDDNKVYEEVKFDGQTVIGSRYVLMKKTDGTIKARLVTKGFQEKGKIKTDSPTASRDSFKVFCSIAANEKWDLEGSDIKSAFLQAEELTREIFIEPPPERRKPGIIWKLLKPCYGLKDASKLWYDSLSKTLMNLGMKRSKTDSCLFYYHEKGKLQGMLLMHIDDILSCGNEEFRTIIIKRLQNIYKFGKTTKGHFSIRQNEKKEIFIDQNNFLNNMSFNTFSNQHYENILSKEEKKKSGARPVN